MMPWWDSWHMGSWGWTGIMIGGLVMLLFWGGVIALAFFAIRAVLGADRTREGGGGSAERRESGRAGALDILKERYARGEITREEYMDMRHDLET